MDPSSGPATGQSPYPRQPPPYTTAPPLGFPGAATGTNTTPYPIASYSGVGGHGGPTAYNPPYNPNAPPVQQQPQTFYPVQPMAQPQPQAGFYYTNAGAGAQLGPPPAHASYGYTFTPSPIPAPTTAYEPPKPDDPQAYGNDITGSLEFSEKSIRLAFIRKVYMLLSVQLMVTAGIIALFTFHDGVKEFAKGNLGFYVGTYVAFIVLLLVLICPCCGNIGRKSPANVICLGIFTIVTGMMLGCVSAQFSVDVVVLAVGSTVLICVGLTIFAFQTKWDFTRLNGTLFVILLVFVLFGFFLGFLRAYYPVARMIYAGIGVLIFSVYLVHDTQLMMGGKHKYALSPEEYIFATINIYLDVIMIFLYILQFFGSDN